MRRLRSFIRPEWMAVRGECPSRELHPRDGTRVQLAGATSSNNMRFRFHLARGGRSPPIPYGSRRRSLRTTAFAGRKLSSMTVLCSVYREHIAKNTGRSVKPGHAMRARAPFSPLEPLPLCRARWRTGNGCQLSTRRRGRTRSILPASEFEKARLCVVLREWLLIGTRAQWADNIYVYIYMISICPCLIVSFLTVIRDSYQIFNLFRIHLFVLRPCDSKLLDC